MTGDVNNHYVKLFGAVLIGGALKGGMSAFQIAATEAAGAGQVTAGLTTLGNQATTKVVQPYINIRPTITVEAGHLCTVLLIKPLHLPAMWQGTHTHHHTEVGMTKAERLAAKIAARQRDPGETARRWPQNASERCGKRPARPPTNGATRSGRWPMRRDCWRGAMPKSPPALCAGS